MIVAVSSSLNPVEAKRAILGRRWLLLDRWVRPSLLVHLRTLHTLVCDLRLKAHAENAIPDQLYEKRFDRWPVDTPSTKEAYYMRDIFDGELAQYANSFRYPVCVNLKCSSHRLVHVRRRSENSRSVCTALFVESAPWLG